MKLSEFLKYANAMYDYHGDMEIVDKDFENLKVYNANIEITITGTKPDWSKSGYRFTIKRGEEV